MSRYILDESKIHPSIQHAISDSYRSFVEEIIGVVQSKPIVVIGMAVNPVCKKPVSY